jgi:broad specificity phosphatase PhoE
MTEQHREIIELALFDLESKSGVRWGPEYMEEFAAAIRAALAEIDALKADANLVSLNAVNAALAAELAALKPQSNADEFASIPLRSWVVEVFQHLCHSPHTPDEWKRDLDKKTIALLDAIEQGKEGQR